MSVLTMIEQKTKDTAIADAVIKNLPKNGTILCVNVNSTEYNFSGYEKMPAKVIHLDVCNSFLDSMIQKVWKFIVRLLNWIGFSISTGSHNINFIADYALGLNKQTNKEEVFRQECRGLKNIYIFVPEEKPTITREIMIL